MIYSPQRGYLFIHIPKTGGTSLAMALEARAGANDIMAGDTPKAQRRKKRLKNLPARGRLWKHSTLADLDGWLSADVVAELYVFTIVRNPWERLASYYCWLRRQVFDHPAVQLAQKLAFSAFLAHPQTQASLQAADYVSYVTDAEGNERCDRFLRLERLKDDARGLEQDLGLSLSIPHVNRSDRPQNLRELYSESDVELVAKLCAADIERFGYAFNA